jgi:segregation and condensation protein B
LDKTNHKIPEEKKVLIPIIEALIFSYDAPLTTDKIRDVIPEITTNEIKNIVNLLNSEYKSAGRSFFIKNIANGFQMFTDPEFYLYIKQLNQNKQKSRLTQKALEALAIIAYKQPITKHDVEEIRGVNSDGVIKTLLSRNLIAIAGRAQAPGIPFIYKTTNKFLDYFGLNAISDLPKLKEIDDLIDIEGESSPYHEILLKEISPDELGLKAYQNGNNKENSKDDSNG